MKRRANTKVVPLYPLGLESRNATRNVRRFEAAAWRQYCVTPPARAAAKEAKGDVTRDDSQRRFLAQHTVAMLEQCCNHSKQCRNAVLR